ncbi:MAG: hypothetical protein IH899_08415 [Planctomycetes bacterium]|nr:hypothetical protein [Planctomycetota bacterium]
MAGAGVRGWAEDETEVEVERLFVQFSNLFAWSDEDDEDGMRVASRWLALPKHALNLRVGKFEPQVIAPWASNHRRLGISGRLPNVATIGGNEFRFEPALRGIEFNGIIRQYNSYAIGLVNGSGAEGRGDNNSEKDFYFRVARKWWGYPLDGQVAPIGGEDEGPAVEVEVGRLGARPKQRHGGRLAAVVRGQTPEDGEEDFGPSVMDFWKEMQFETGFFGYFGHNEIEEPEETLDRFERLGFDARWQSGDLDVFGAWIWGWDNDLGIDSEESLFTWFVEADYYFKPWMIGYVRYEELNFQEMLEDNEVRRLVPGAAIYVRTNLRVLAEILVDTSGNDTTNDSLQFLLDFAY